MSLKRIQRRLVRILAVLVVLSAIFCAGLYVYRTFLGYNYDSTLQEEDLAAGIKATKTSRISRCSVWTPARATPRAIRTAS